MSPIERLRTPSGGRIVVLASVTLVVTVAAWPARAGPFTVVPVDASAERAYGKTYAQWSAEWWKWVEGIPAAENPVLDPDGRFAGVNQPDAPMWFLAGNFGVLLRISWCLEGAI